MLSDAHRLAVLALLERPERTGADMRALADSCGVSLATAYRWVGRVQADQRHPAVRRSRQDRGGSRLAASVEARVQMALGRVQAGEIGVDAAYAELKSALRADSGGEPPSRATFYRRWRTFRAALNVSDADPPDEVTP